MRVCVCARARVCVAQLNTIHNNTPHITLTACHTPVDLIIVLDVSGSIGVANFDIVRKFVSNLAMDLDVDGGVVRIGLMTFSDQAQSIFYLNTFR